MLKQMDPDVRFEWDAMRSRFTQMVRNGILELDITERPDGSSNYAYTTRDPKTRAVDTLGRQEQRERRAREHPDDSAIELIREAERLDIAAQSARQGTQLTDSLIAAPKHLPTVAELIASGPTVPELPEHFRGQPWCLGCYALLPDDARERGYHAGCASAVLRN